MTEKITASLEDYLEAFLSLEDEQKNIKMSDVALELNVSKASVHKAIQILKEKGYANQEKYGKLELTDDGRIIAMQVRKRHNVIKRFLTDVLKVEENIADSDACKMEHNISTETFYKLERFIETYKEV